MKMVTGCVPRDHDDDDDDHHHDQEEHDNMIMESHRHVGYGIAGGVIIVLVALITFSVFLAYWCHEKHKRDRVIAVLDQVSSKSQVIETKF